MTAAIIWAMFVKGGYSNHIGGTGLGEKIRSAVENVAVAVSTTDFNGRTTFEGIVAGEYFVLCASPLGIGIVLEKRVEVKGKAVQVSLDNENALQRE